MGIPRLNKETSLFRANAIPDYVAGVVTEAKAAIKVTTDQISSEVSRKVGASEVISRINQSPESVTIDADRLDIATSTDGGDGVFVHPRNDATTGWRISDVLELLKGGVSAFRVWLEGGLAKVRIGESDGNHALLDGDSFDIYHDDTQMAHFGYGDGTASGGTGTAPYYTLGRRADPTTNVYSSSSTYSVGARVLYDNEEYICIRAITTPEAWTANHWQRSIGNWSVAVGNRVTASGYSSYAEGNGTTAIGGSSHAEGSSTFVRGAGSHAEGSNTSVSGHDSHAEGYRTTVSGDYSHAEGSNTTASGNSSHAEGSNTTASGNSSHAQNFGTVAAYINQTAIGKFNDNQSNHAFEIGNGTSESNRSNAFAITWDGRPEYGTDVSTSVLADIISAESGVTFTRANYVQSGRMAMLELRFTLDSAISVPAGGNIGDITIGTLVTGKRPATNCHPVSNGDGAGTSSYYMGTDGKLLMCGVEGTGVARTINAGMEFTLACTYIIA